MNQTVYQGINVRFSVKALGNTPFAYQWSLGGADLIDATNRVLTLTNVQPSQAGIYAVLITNIYGPTTSSNAELTVNPPPPCLPLPSGLVAWWSAEGNANDIIGTNDGS